ncbi:MAG: polysaccharide biosynthesis protein [Flavobacteriales bacterium]|nr:polysaccharide biosynthesis protein [Flavobacteriales bacterium]
MKFVKKLAGQTAIYGLSSVIGRLLNYLLVPIYTRYFMPEEYGVVTEIYAYVAFFVVLLTYGLETAFFRFSNNKYEAKKVYSTALVSLMFSSFTFVCTLFFFAPSISVLMGYGIETRFVYWFAIILGIDAISSISFAKLRNEEKAITFATVQMVNIIVNIGLNVYFIVYQRLGIEYIFVSNLIASVITLLLLTPEMLRSKFTFDRKIWYKMMVYALPLLIAGLAGMTNETIDRVLLKHMLPNPETASFELGLYGAFYKLSIIMILFVQTFRFAAEPFFFAQHQKKESRQVYADIMKYFIIVMIVIFLTVIIFYDFAISFLGQAYHDERGFLVVSLLLLANLFLGVFYNLSIWYKLIEKTIYGAYLAIFGAIITLVLNTVLIPKIGFVGCAWATLVCYFGMSLLSYFLSKKHFFIPYQTHRIILYLIVMLGIYFFVATAHLNILINSLFLLGFIIFAYLLEKPKKA